MADDSPLWADVAADGTVRSFGQRGADPLVTGGVYWLNDKARREATAAVGVGVQRLRGFLAQLIAEGNRVQSVVVPRIVDVDTGADLALAAALVEGDAL